METMTMGNILILFWLGIIDVGKYLHDFEVEYNQNRKSKLVLRLQAFDYN